MSHPDKQDFKKYIKISNDYDKKDKNINACPFVSCLSCDCVDATDG